MSEKEFDNFLVTANSPRGRSPPFSSKKLELMEWEMAAPRVRLQHNVLRIFHMINAVFCVKFHTSFFLRMMHNGGCEYFSITLEKIHSFRVLPHSIRIVFGLYIHSSCFSGIGSWPVHFPAICDHLRTDVAHSQWRWSSLCHLSCHHSRSF